MSAVACSVRPAFVDQPLVSFDDFGLRSVERKMRHLVSADTVVAPVQLAILYHLDSGRSRPRARLALNAGESLGIRLDDAVAIAACAELAHSASRLRTEAHDCSRSRNGRTTVRAEFGDQTASSAGDVLLSAAYAALASVCDRSRVAELVQQTHAAMAATTDGCVKNLALKNVFVSDYDVYERVATDKSAPLLSLPLQLTMAYGNVDSNQSAARRAVEHLALANQIAEDLESAKAVEQPLGDREWLNVLTVLRNMGISKPAKVASANAFAALRKSIRFAERLPHGIGASLTPCLDTVFHRLESAAR